MFYFVVRYLRWAARVPGLPHLFDASLLAGTCVFHRTRLAAMETFEAEALRLPGVRLKTQNPNILAVSIPNSDTFTDTVCWTFLSDGKQPAYCSPVTKYASITYSLAPNGSASKSNRRRMCHSRWNC